jgi:hypothetical protein
MFRMKTRNLSILVGGAVLVGVLALAQPPTDVRAQDGDTVTVSGCLERDAASRAVVYKLIARDVIYRLTAPATINLAAELGHTIEVTGTLTRREAGGREELSIAVRQMKTVSNQCA